MSTSMVLSLEEIGAMAYRVLVDSGANEETSRVLSRCHCLGRTGRTWESWAQTATELFGVDQGWLGERASRAHC